MKKNIMAIALALLTTSCSAEAERKTGSPTIAHMEPATTRKGEVYWKGLVQEDLKLENAQGEKAFFAQGLRLSIYPNKNPKAPHVLQAKTGRKYHDIAELRHKKIGSETEHLKGWTGGKTQLLKNREGKVLMRIPRDAELRAYTHKTLPNAWRLTSVSLKRAPPLPFELIALAAAGLVIAALLGKIAWRRTGHTGRSQSVTQLHGKPRTLPAITGTAVHNSIERWCHAWLWKPKLETLIEGAKSEIQQRSNGHNQQDIDSATAKAKQCLENWERYQEQLKQDGWKRFRGEVLVRCPKRTADVGGFADMVCKHPKGDLLVTEFKTGKTPNNGNPWPNHLDQVETYGALIHGSWRKPKGDIRIQTVYLDNPKPIVLPCEARQTLPTHQAEKILKGLREG